MEKVHRPRRVTREGRQSLVAACARPLVFMLAMPFVGAWYLGTMPADSRGWAMPPFAGTPAEVEAIVQLIGWRHAGRPAEWALSEDPAVLAQIERWLDEAGTGPGDVRLALGARRP